ncbi:hypothetical protein EUX98_g3839 [Antrodiella citrinella]|uniref:RRN6 K-rich C-terminal domain-containing protein n=1 Tax=Antrodiella citrinella TaxID=2447956 RepID=A0A4S4N3M6_9APHY|nr:hypothetical protein EUX98_g3839 [Antrodiella citrinella]
MSSDPAALTSTLGKYNLMSEDDRPAPSYRREAEAREQLALDLTLSATVYSAGFNDVKQKEEEDEILEVMSRATKALSLEHTEPPPVSFGFLRPLKTEEEGTFLHSDSETSICPLGVRLLLDDWKVGVDPADYIYEDPYGMVGAAPAIRPTARPRPLPETIAPVVQTLRPPITTRPPMIAASQPTCPPPTIFPSSQPQEVRRDIGWGSQPNTMDWVQHTASQEPFSRTQAMPGPHGGRPPPMKKKKRAGGF